MRCKITKKRIKPFMSFGKMPIANGFIKKENFKKEFFFKMEVGFSKDLSLFQLNDHPKPTKMFNENYPFFTSSSKYMVKHFKDYSKWVKKNYGKNLSTIIEIGSNDGSFLKNFKSKKTKILGIEPSKNVADLANKYQTFFKSIDYNFFKEPENSKSNYWLNSIVLKDKQQRDKFLEETNSNGVMTRPIWTLMNKLEMFKNAQFDDLANSMWIEERVVNIPSSVRV